MKLVVGLGNPGIEYVGTRHNVGFEVVDAVAERLGWVGPGEFERRAKSSFDGLVIDGMLSLHSTGGTEKLVLLKPMTYMNVSGKSVRAAMDFFKLVPSEVIVIVDELALPCGKLRLRPDGSDGGHNGLKSVQQMLGTKAYPRLRVGIDAPPPQMAGKDYVLGKYTPEQKAVMKTFLARAAGCVATWADEGITMAMNRFNSESP
jgi:peptidyl-tRNA hydrolase, PTH1 family